MHSDTAEIADRVPRLKVAHKPQYVVPSGDMVTISGDGLDLSAPWFGDFKCSLRDHTFGFQFGPTGTTANAIVAWSDIVLHEGYSLADGTLSISRAAAGNVNAVGALTRAATDPELWVASWQGRWHELYTFHLDPSTALDAFGFMELRDSLLGLEATPRPATWCTTFGLNVQKEIPGLGFVTIMPIDEAAGLVPKHNGTQVAGGQLFLQAADANAHRPDATHIHDDEDAEPQGFFLLVARTAVATVEPSDDRVLGDPHRLSLLETLQISWESAVRTSVQ